MLLPNPVQAGQAPNGLLNENILGAISGKLMPQSTQAKFSLNMNSAPSITCTKTTPSPKPSAISSESANRLSIPSRMIKRSTTTSIVCFLFFSNLISSLISWISPSIRTLT